MSVGMDVFDLGLGSFFFSVRVRMTVRMSTVRMTAVRMSMIYHKPRKLVTDCAESPGREIYHGRGRVR